MIGNLVVGVVSTSTCCAGCIGAIAMYMAGKACTTAKSLYTHAHSCDNIGEGPLGMPNNYNKHVPLLMIVVAFICEWLSLWLVQLCI